MERLDREKRLEELKIQEGAARLEREKQIEQYNIDR
jgi:hypothetical protein